MHLVFRVIEETRASYLAVYASPEAMYPWGADLYLYRPHGVIEVVKCLFSSARATEW